MKQSRSGKNGMLAALVVLCCVISSLAAAQQSAHDSGITVQVGSRLVKTTKRTAKGTPVVPMWKAPMPSRDLSHGAGLPLLKEAQHATVWTPANRAQGAYNHFAALVFYKGRFFAMWGNSTEGEDAPGQRVLFAWSDRWGKWSAPQELFPAPGPVKPRSEKGIYLNPDRWIVIDDRLYAVAYVHRAGIYPIARSVSAHGRLGRPFVVKELPRNASLPVFMKNKAKNTAFRPSYTSIKNWYRDHHQVSWWARSGEGGPDTGVDGSPLIESFSYQARDGGMVLFMRSWGSPHKPTQNNRLYVSFSDGKSGWSLPYPTDIPDAPSRAQALSLADSTVLLIGNQIAWTFDHALYLDRDPLTVSVSEDGYTFDRVYALRTGAPKTYRIPGVKGRNPGFAYPSALVHDGWLYVLYSIGKEDMAISRVPLSEMGL